jgi:hypothetical protein
VKLWNGLRGWAGANAAALRLCFRMTVAGLLAYVQAEFFALPQGYWAVDLLMTSEQALEISKTAAFSSLNSETFSLSKN